MKFKFRKFNFDPETLDPSAIKCFLEILKLISKHKTKLFDDFISSNLSMQVLDLINLHFPYFWVIYEIKSEKFVGFAYLYDIIGPQNQLHTATVATCFEKSFWGKGARVAGKTFLEYVFKKLRLSKLKAESFGSNPWAANYLKALGFKKEGILKRESVVEGKEEDLITWAVFSP